MVNSSSISPYCSFYIYMERYNYKTTKIEIEEDCMFQNTKASRKLKQCCFCDETKENFKKDDIKCPFW